MRRVQPLAAQQLADLARPGARVRLGQDPRLVLGVNVRRLACSTSSGSGTPAGAARPPAPNPSPATPRWSSRPAAAASAGTPAPFVLDSNISGVSVLALKVIDSSMVSVSPDVDREGALPGRDTEHVCGLPQVDDEWIIRVGRGRSLGGGRLAKYDRRARMAVNNHTARRANDDAGPVGHGQCLPEHRRASKRRLPIALDSSEKQYTNRTPWEGLFRASSRQKPRLSGAFLLSGRQDLNLRPPGPQPGIMSGPQSC